MKRKLIAVTLLAAMVLTGCGSKGFTGEKSADLTDDKNNKTTATVNFEDGKPVSVNIDVTQADGTMKSEASESGAYDMKNAPGKKWHEQVDLLENAIVENGFDLTKITYTNEAGNTDAISGVTIKVKGYVDLVQQALDQAK